MTSCPEVEGVGNATPLTRDVRGVGEAKSTNCPELEAVGRANAVGCIGDVHVAAGGPLVSRDIDEPAGAAPDRLHVLY